MNSGWQAFFRFLDLALLLAILALPYWLIVEYPKIAPDVGLMYAVTVPWVISLYIVAMFQGGIGQAFHGIGQALMRIKRAGFGAAQAEFHDQQARVTENPDSPPNAVTLHWYMRFIGAVVYGSQFEALSALRDGSMTRDRLKTFYQKYLDKGGPPNYSFEGWFGFMTSNFLVRINEEGQFEIAEGGAEFIKTAINAGLDSSSFQF